MSPLEWFFAALSLAFMLGSLWMKRWEDRALRVKQRSLPQKFRR